MPDGHIYFDEDVPRDLVESLRGMGLATYVPRDVGTVSAIDAVHLGMAASRGWILVTRNRRDFRRLHWLWTALNAWGVLPQPHGGILTVYEGESGLEPSEWATAISSFLQRHERLEGEMHMWRRSSGVWQRERPAFM